MNIFTWLSSLFTPSVEARRQAGYDYAAGELLRGVTVEEVECMADDPWTPDNPFNYGMRAAIRDWEQKGQKS